MTPDLSRRLANALDVGSATAYQRQLVVAAAQTAVTFEDLPPGVQELVVELEQVPAGG